MTRTCTAAAFPSLRRFVRRRALRSSRAPPGRRRPPSLYALICSYCLSCMALLCRVAVPSVADPQVRDVAVSLNVKVQPLFFQHGVATGFDAGDPIVLDLDRIGWRSVRAE